jgi:thiol-disulfide isomerase/thioredoxin
MPARLGSLATTVVVLLALAASAVAADRPKARGASVKLPRYWLKVGQELNYVTSKEFTTNDGRELKTDANWQLWVVRQNDDGGWRLVLRHALSIPSPENQKPAKDKPAEGPSERVTLAHFDLFPDGRVVLDPSQAFRIEPALLFLRLPKTSQEAADGWEDMQPTTQVKYRYRLKPMQRNDDESESWVAEATRESAMDEILASTSKSTFYFNRERGLVERVETKDSQGYLIIGKGEGETELADVGAFKTDWCRQLDEEVDAYLAADQKYQQLMGQAERDADNTDILLVRAAHLLQTAAEEASLPVVKEQFEQQLADHKAAAAIVSRNARDRADLLGQPSPLWQAVDLSGHRHSLKDYKGKVVVLDFWHRGCGWCIRSMPQVKQIAEEFLGRPVVVLGMSTDRDEKDARLVVSKLKLSYPILKAEALPAKYMIPGFPTLLILDQKGVVHDMYVGYSPTLGKDVSAVIEELLEGARASE